MPRRIRIFQGEDRDTRYNTLVGEFVIEGLAEVPAGNQILVRLELDLEWNTQGDGHRTGHRTRQARRDRQRDGTVPPPPAQRCPGTPRRRFRQSRGRRRALTALEGLDQDHELSGATTQDAALPGVRQATVSAHALIAKAKGLLPAANAEDAEELRAMLTDLEAALDRGVEDDIRAVSREVEEIVFYLEDV